MTLTNKIKSNRGFSLMEFLIVIGILAVIAIVAIPITVGVINSSNKQNDEVLASTYSEYMQKFATEQAGSIGYYPTLKDDGAGSDYDLLKNSSGKGSFPGITQLDSRINQLNEDEVWNLIRKEACIAISAYSGDELADPVNYYVERPHDESMAFVYYYLTGTVALKPVEEMENSKVTTSEVENSAVDTEDFWVYLDRQGGSGKAVSAPDSRDFYVKVIQFGTGLPVNGAEVTINPGSGSTGAERKATTTSTGLLVFRDVYSHIITSAKREGAITWWDAVHYAGKQYEVNLTLEPTKGTITNPFIIELKMGSLGGVDLQETFKVNKADALGNTRFEIVHATIEQANDFKTNFVKFPDSDYARDEVYHTSAPGSNPFSLLAQDNTGTFRFLLYGDYGMTVTNSTGNFVTYTENITSDVYGIYNKENPQDKWVNFGSAYDYPVVLTRTDTFVTGVIAAENKWQPLHGEYTDLSQITGNPKDAGTKVLGTTSGSIIKGQSTNVSSSSNQKITVVSYVKVVNKQNGLSYKSANLTPMTNDNGDYIFTSDGAYKYEFNVCIPDDHSGAEYEVYLITEYGDNNEVMTVSKWPTPITADGCTYKLEMSNQDYVQVNLESDVSNVDFNLYCFEDYGVVKALKYNVELQRLSFSNEYHSGLIVQRPGTLLPNGLVSTNSATNIATTAVKNNVLKYKTLNVSAVAKRDSKNDQGVANFENIKKGFYKVVITYDPIYGYAPDEYIIFVDEGNYVIKKDKGTTYTFKCIPTTANGVVINQNGILKEKTGYWEGITFNVTVDNATNVPYTVVHNSDGSATISVRVGYVADYIKVTQSVSCFDSTDKYEHTGSLPSTALQSFYISRIENDNEDGHSLSWHWESLGAKHTYFCNRCNHGIYTADHYVDGSGEGRNTTTYFTNILTANNNSTHNGHLKHCDICDLYDESESCTSDNKWTPKYNYAVAGAAHTSVHKGSTSSYVMFDRENASASESDSYHYQHCTFCKTRVDCNTHTSVYSGGVHTNDEAVADGFGFEDIGDGKHQFHCNICGYKREAVACNSSKEVVTYYAADGTSPLGSSSGATYKDTSKYCTGCGHRTAYQRENLHTHSWSYFCGYRHTGYWKGYYWCTAQGTNHCWDCGAYATFKTDEEGKPTDEVETYLTECHTHSNAKFGCMTCSCGLSRYAVGDGTSRWCGHHYGFYSGNKRWTASWGGIENKHHDDTKW